MENRIDIIGAIVIMGSGGVLLGSLGLLSGGPYATGYAIIAIFLSATIWWLASALGELYPVPVAGRVANHLNALAAAAAAYAGFLTTQNGWHDLLAVAGAA